jgi:hypothetical protein
VTDISGSSFLAAAGIENANLQILAFNNRFDDRYMDFACHAAYPLLLTPELLYCLWTNFQTTIEAKPLNIPWIAVADLLLSGFCEEVGYELYEMDAQIRNQLLRRLKADSRFGPQRIEELSEFIISYIEGQPKNKYPYTIEFVQAQKWAGLAYRKPPAAARQIAKAFQQSIHKENRAEQMHLANVVETLSEPLASFDELINYARANKQLIQGIPPGFIFSEEVDIGGVKLPPIEPPTNKQESRPGLISSEEVDTGNVKLPAILRDAAMTVNPGPETGVAATSSESLLKTSDSTIDALSPHYQNMMGLLKKGRVVFFLGSEINRYGRAETTGWQPGQSSYLPDNNELAEYLAQKFGYPANFPKELERVSQHIVNVHDVNSLYKELHDIFSVEYQPNIVHQFFAGLPGLLREKGASQPYQLIVTTNYDDTLERAFSAAGEAFDLITYVTTGAGRGEFWQQASDGKLQRIKRPNENPGFSLKSRSVILKLYGGVNRHQPERESFVIGENDFIDYPNPSDINSLIPVNPLATLRRNNFLFLGYHANELGLRIIQRRILTASGPRRPAWALQANASVEDLSLWQKSKIEPLNIQLDHYIVSLSQYLSTTQLPEVNKE